MQSSENVPYSPLANIVTYYFSSPVHFPMEARGRPDAVFLKMIASLNCRHILQTVDVNLIPWVSLDRYSANSDSTSCASGEDTGATWASETCYTKSSRHRPSVPNAVSFYIRGAVW